ncbi:MAG: transporter substrate-binding domain-containing protein [Methyloligellaceae bacterium]
MIHHHRHASYLLFRFLFVVLFTVSFAQNLGAQSDGNRKAPDQTEQNPAESGADSIWRGSVLRFLTDTDYPPFNYYDEDGSLVGFNVDVARAICLELDVNCEIQAGNWDQLIPNLNRGDVDGVIASLSINSQNLARVTFTDRYFKSPARFVSRADENEVDVTPEALEDAKLGVIAKSAHEAYLKEFFSESEITTYEDQIKLREALISERVDYIFADAVGLMFWINGTEAVGCCVFRGGAFTESKYFGDGIGIAVKKGNHKLLTVLNDALNSIRNSSRYEELVLRYFPFKFY